MPLGKSITWIGFFTVLSLVYIHLQMQMIDLAYEGKLKEKEIHRLIETKGNLTYAILSVKSSYNLGGKMLTADSNMRFADPANVVHMATPRDVLRQEEQPTDMKENLSSNRLMGWLTFATRAEARDRKD